jgi:hypothetical protein
VRRSRVGHRRITVRGRSRDRGCAGLARVFVSIAREVGDRHERCRFLQANGRFSRARSCLRTSYLRARGTKRWTFTLRARVKRGRYKVWVRGVDRAGNVERKQHSRNFARLKRKRRG